MEVAEPEHAEAEAYSLECACVQKPDAYCKGYVYIYFYIHRIYSQVLDFRYFHYIYM